MNRFITLKINFTGTHIKSGSTVHLHIEPLCYNHSGNKSSTISDNTDSENQIDYKMETNPVSDQPLKQNDKWLIYPNPGSDIINIRREFVNDGDFLYLYSMTGQFLGKTTLDNAGSANIEEFIGNNKMLLISLYSNQTFMGSQKWTVK